MKRWVKEPFCGVSHFVGALLSVAGLAALLVAAHGRPRYIAAFLVYGLSLVLLYSASTLYHSLHLDERRTEWFQRMDYTSIFALIAGTYTPVCALALRGWTGWGMLAAEYAMAAVGITAVLVWKNAPHWLRVILYIAMGWLAALALPELRAALSPAAVWWLLAGGLSYTGGVVFYAMDRPRFLRSPLSTHDLWHLFVMAGSACHFLVVLRFIA